MLRIARSALVYVLFGTLLCAGSLSAQTTTYYFKGNPDDQVNKVGNDTVSATIGTATFDTTPPTGLVPVTQTGSPFTNEDYVGNPLGIYWSGNFSGSVSGVIDLQWYWSTQNAATIALGGQIQVSVFADPDYTQDREHTGTLIGRGIAPLTAISAIPTLISTQIPINGTVQHTLLIQVVPQFSDAGNGINVHYNSTSTPSSFTFHSAPARVPFPAAPKAGGLAPRYTALTPTLSQQAAGLGIDAGEPSIGSNWISGNALFQSFLTTFRVTFDDSCAASPFSTWTAKQSPLTGTESFDPILYTDSKYGRTMVSQLILASTESAAAITDNDGDTWLPSHGAGIASGIDHQTLGGGPFHAPIPTGATYQNAIYYCAQDIALANCAISLDGGLTFGPAVPIYTSQQCGGLHGHIKVGPDGTAYVPNKDCGGLQGVVVSEDNGITWDIRKVPNSLAANSDPSVAISKGGRVYLAFADNDNHPVVAVSNDRGHNWTTAKDVGALDGINNAVFPVMVAGDDDRAAVAYVGTKSAGSLQDRGFPGVWYMYIASTYDGGNSWHNVNATPNDPVQRGPIWLKGGGEISRNLLDFNDATIDREGRVLVGYADGCVGGCSQSPDAARGNSYSAVASILRQSGGRRMFAANDPAEPTAPGAPSLTVTRNGGLAKLSWSEGNDGGSAITKYSVYRDDRLIATTTSPSYTDATIDASKSYSYRVTATNASGTSCGNNVVSAAPTGSSCTLPGVAMVSDATGDSTAAATPALDIQSLAIAEPYYADGSKKIVFTMKVASLATIPPNGIWRVLWNFPTTVGGSYYVQMNSDAAGAISFQYGEIDITSAVVTSIGQPHPLGAPDAASAYSPDGTIRFVLAGNTIGNPVAGDLLGGILVRTFITTGDVVTTSRTAIDAAGTPNAYVVVGNDFCKPPVVTCIEDDDSHIAYSNGWHLVSASGASAGHFRMGAGKPSATLTFTVPANQYGAVTYNYAKSSKGGSAEILLDGVSQGTISFAGSTGGMKDPQFGFNIRYGGLAAGSHTLEIRGNGVTYIDGFCLESSASSGSPSSGPGATQSSSTTLAGGATSLLNIIVPANAQGISIVAESSSGLVKIVLVDATGLSLATADTSSGVAVINQPVTAGGVFAAKLVSANAGPVVVNTLVTPLVSR